MSLWGLNRKGSGEGPLSLPKARGIKSFEDYSEEQVAEYSDIVESLEPESIDKMVEKTIDLGIPASFVSGYFDVDVSVLSRLVLGVEDEYIVKRSILEKYLKNKVLVLSTERSEIEMIRDKAGSSEIVEIRDLDGLIPQLEQGTEALTLWITSSMPVDIKGSMDLLSEHLNELDGLYYIEVGTERYFEKSLHFNNWSEFDMEEVREVDTSRGDVEERIKRGGIKRGRGVREEVDRGSDVGGVKEPERAPVRESVSEVVREPVKREVPKKEDKFSIFQDNLNMLDEELDNYKRLYSRKYEESEKLKERVAELEESSIEAERVFLEKGKDARKIEELGEEIEAFKREIASLDNQNEILSEDIKKLRVNYADLDIENRANRELLEDKNTEYGKLKEKYDNLSFEYDKIQEEVTALLEDLPDVDAISDLEDEVGKKEEEIHHLNSMVRELRIELKKSEELERLRSNEYTKMERSYRDLLNKGEVKVDTIDVKNLDDDVDTHMFYFKVINQPPYFRSFVTGLTSILDESSKILTVVIKETDELSEYYFGGLRKVNVLEEVDAGDSEVWLKPSKLMFTDDDSFYSQYDYIIVLDYVETTKRFIRGNQVTFISVLMNEEEKELLNVNGMILSGGDQSIVDMRYDRKYEAAKTPFIREKYTQSKIQVWLRSMGLI